MTHLVKVALWGIGAHARKNLVPAMRTASGIELVGVFSRDEGARSWAAGELSCQAYASPDDLLAGPAEAVYLAIPPALHHEAGMAVVTAGKHLWCEKPLTIGVEQARDLAAAAARHGVGVFEALMYQHHPQFEKVLELVDSGRLGVVRSVEASFGIPHLDPGNHRYRADLGGGALTDAACYPVSFAGSILGPEPRVLEAFIWTDPGYEVDTRGSAFLVGRVDTIGLITWGFGFSYRNEAVVWGSDARLIVPRAFSKPADLTTTLTLVKSDGSETEVQVPPSNHFSRMIGRFAADVANGRHAQRTRTSVRQASVMALIANEAATHPPYGHGQVTGREETTLPAARGKHV